MTCRELTDFLADYLDHTLPPHQRAQFEEHLAICGDCRHYLASYRQTIQLGKAAFSQLDAPVTQDVPEGLVKAILAARPASDE